MNIPSVKRGIDYLLNDRIQLCDSIVKIFFSWLPDKAYLSLRYRFQMGHWINWKSPNTFSEKLQWLKIYNRKPIYTIMVDKYAVKKYVTDRIGNQYIIPTIGVWDKVEDIDWESLPSQFVLKTTHGGGGCGVVVCHDINNFDKSESIAKLKESLGVDIYTELREWPYKNVPKRIIAEVYLNTSTGELNDYKFFCFSGKVKFYKVDFGRFIEHHANYYSPDGELLAFGETGLEPDPKANIQQPNNIEEMIILAEKLSEGEPFLRVDFYNVNGKIYFGELTFYPASGMIPWTTNEADAEIGNYLSLKQ